MFVYNQTQLSKTFGNTIDPLNRNTLSKSFCGVGAELGVARAHFSETILKNSGCCLLYSIDRWSGDRGHDDSQYAGACRRLAVYDKRSRIVKASFTLASNLIDDYSLDFIYIDGYAHTGQDQGATLYEWWPKLKYGGIFAGHDYCSKFPLTIKMVNLFAATNNLNISKTQEDDCNYPSWYTIK